MKTEKQINLEKWPAAGQSLTLAAVALAGLALAAGCSSEREARVSYHSPRSETYAEARVTTDTAPGQPSVVVTPDRPDAAGAAESPGSQTTGVVTTFEPDEIITDQATLFRGHDSATLQGRPVSFSSLKVQEVNGDRFLFTLDNGRPMYALYTDRAANVQPGDTVTVTGTLQRGDGSDAGLAAAGPQPPMSQPYYIEIEKIDTANK